MGRRGPKPKGKANTEWCPELAYAVGLIATDGCLSGDGRHIDLTSKDKEQLVNFMKCVGATYKISTKKSGYNGGMQKRIQFSDVLFYQFLTGRGLTPAKSKTMGKLSVPVEFFFDFLRGAFDGDGSFHSYYDPRWKSSFVFYLSFASASKKHLDWIQRELVKLIVVKGHMTKAKNSSVYQLKYAKRETLKIIKNMYYSDTVVCLSRKRLKIEKALKVDNKSLLKLFAQVA